MDDDSSYDDIDSDSNSSADSHVSFPGQSKIYWSNYRTKKEQHFIKSSAEKLKKEFKEAQIEATAKLNTNTQDYIKNHNLRRK